MNKKKNQVKTVGKIVEDYMYERPYLLFMASQGIVNITALARKIKNDAKNIVNDTNVNIHSNYAVLVADIKQQINAKNIISYSDKQVCIGEKSNLQKYKNKAEFYRDELVLIELRHANEIEDTPGVLFHILAKFYEQSISILEIFSAYDSTYILIEKEDVQKIMKMFFR